MPSVTPGWAEGGMIGLTYHCSFMLFLSPVLHQKLCILCWWSLHTGKIPLVAGCLYSESIVLFYDHLFSLLSIHMEALTFQCVCVKINQTWRASWHDSCKVWRPWRSWCVTKKQHNTCGRSWTNHWVSILFRPGVMRFCVTSREKLHSGKVCVTEENYSCHTHYNWLRGSSSFPSVCLFVRT